MRIVCLAWLAVVVGTGVCGAAVPPAAAPRPNFVVILIDDMGYGDIGPFGSKLNRTPCLDRMAAAGMKLTSFYAAPVCTPSRAQMMTGCYAKRVSLPNVLGPVSRIGISSTERTVADLLKQQGYATMCIGKWHLGDQPPFLPTRHGFDHYVGLPYSNDMGGSGRPRRPAGRPFRCCAISEVVEAPVRQDKLVELYTEEAVKFITANKDRPFFLYLPHTAVHVPIHPGKAFQGQSANGRYGDWVEEVDWSTGRVLDTLHEAEARPPDLRALHQRQRAVAAPRARTAAWPDRSAAARARRGKGASASRRIAWWPGRIAAGAACDAMMSEMDVLPTLVRLAGGTVPGDRVIDGRDIWPLLSGQSKKSPHEALFYFMSNRLEAVRSGPWKLAIVEQIGMGREEAEGRAEAVYAEAVQSGPRHRREDRRGRPASGRGASGCRATSGRWTAIWA